jgi:hypothetical protein
MLGAPGDDGVFRYQPSPVEEDLPKPEDDSDEVAEWFTTQTDPAIAQAVAKAEAEARATTPGIGVLPASPEDPLPPMQYPPLSQQSQNYPPPSPPQAPGRHGA